MTARQRTGHPVGVKGRSGRKGYSDELKIRKLGNLCVNWAIAEMEKPKSRFKKDIALKVLPALFPKIIAGDADNSLAVVIKGFNYIKPDDKVHNPHN